MLHPPAIIVIFAFTALLAASAPMDNMNCTSFVMENSNDEIHPLCTNQSVRVHETAATANAQAVLPTSPMVPLHGNENDKQNNDNDDDIDQHVIAHGTTGDDIDQNVDQGADHLPDYPINHDTGSDMDHDVDHDMDHDTDNDIKHEVDHNSGNDTDHDLDDNDTHNTVDHDTDHDTINDTDHVTDHDLDDNNTHNTVGYDTDHNTINGTKIEPDHGFDNGDGDKHDDEQDMPYNATGSKNKSGLTVMLKDDKNFCIFLPSSPGNRDENNGKNDPSAISDSEKSARVFCSSKTSQHAVPGGKPMPKGFIKSATFASNPSRHFVQVTGSIDRDAYALSPKDGGGQYDNHGAGSPPESQCIGYPYFVALVEPDINHFCIRCCQWYSDCHAGRSAYGCQRVVPELPPDDL